LISGNEQTFVADRLHHYQRNPHRRRPRAPPMTGFLALTFGTLLSSQGTDAHRSRPFGLSRGNRSTLCPLGPRCQKTDSVLAVQGGDCPPARPLARPGPVGL